VGGHPPKLLVFPPILAVVAMVLLLGLHLPLWRNARLPVITLLTKPQTVCLDPGHGGVDPGATNQNITERDINLTVALQVRELLERQGYRVFMTRTTNDSSLSNHDRYTYCNQRHATIMVSIHHNFFDDTSTDYDTALYYKDADQALATSVLGATSAKLGLTNDGITQFDDGVLSESNMPAALSEAFFVTDDDEYAKLTQPGSSRLGDEAQGIATGIMNYFAPAQKPAPNINHSSSVIHN
jgi:N-acetylmuramoyl-L-alanine amidase